MALLHVPWPQYFSDMLRPRIKLSNSTCYTGLATLLTEHDVDSSFLLSVLVSPKNAQKAREIEQLVF